MKMDSDRNIDYKIKGQKAIEQEIGCKFALIDPDKVFLSRVAWG